MRSGPVRAGQARSLDGQGTPQHKGEEKVWEKRGRPYGAQKVNENGWRGGRVSGVLQRVRTQKTRKIFFLFLLATQNNHPAA